MLLLIIFFIITLNDTNYCLIDIAKGLIFQKFSKLQFLQIQFFKHLLRFIAILSVDAR